MRFLMVVVLAMLLNLSLTGCELLTKTITKVEYLEKPVNPALLYCKGEPLLPVKITDKTVAFWIIDLKDAGDDCRGKLESLRKSILANGD